MPRLPLRFRVTRPRWGLFAAAVLLLAWIVSWYFPLMVRAANAAVGTGFGGIVIYWTSGTPAPPPKPLPWFEFGRSHWPPLPTRWWFDYETVGTVVAPSATYHFAFVPLWAPALACAAPTMLRLIRRPRAQPTRVCHRCGYNLTGLPESAPCPECGRTPDGPPVITIIDTTKS